MHLLSSRVVGFDLKVSAAESVNHVIKGDEDGRICPRRYDNYVLLEELADLDSDLNLPASMLCFRINSQKALRFL